MSEKKEPAKEPKPRPVTPPTDNTEQRNSREVERIQIKQKPQQER